MSSRRYEVMSESDSDATDKETGEAKNIVFGLTGTGYFDLVAYQKYHDGLMDDYCPTDEDLAVSLAKLPKID